MEHVKQFCRGLRVLAVILTAPIWILPVMIYEWGGNTPEPPGMW